MASGVKVADKVKDLYNEMKVKKTDDDEKERLRVVSFEIKSGYIVPKEIYREKDMAGKDVYQFVQSLLKPQECTYLLYDCHYATKESAIKEDLVFMMWAHEEASIKLKMQYAASKDPLRKAMTGIKHEMQFNDHSDCGTRDNFAEKLGKGVTHLEGVPLCAHK